jgi:hypothetical protein
MKSGRAVPGAGTPAELVRRQIEALNRRDLDAVASCYADDAILEIGSGRAIVGRAAILRAYERHAREWEETVALIQVSAHGGRVTASGVAAGRHRSPRLNIPGRVPVALHPYRHSFRATWQIDTGKITRHRVEYDPQDLVRQLLAADA